MMLVGDCECEEWLWVPLYDAIDKLGLRAGFDAVVAASNRGLTALAVGGAWGVEENDALGV